MEPPTERQLELLRKMHATESFIATLTTDTAKKWLEDHLRDFNAKRNPRLYSPKEKRVRRAAARATDFARSLDRQFAARVAGDD